MEAPIAQISHFLLSIPNEPRFLLIWLIYGLPGFSQVFSMAFLFYVWMKGAARRLWPDIINKLPIEALYKATSPITLVERTKTRAIKFLLGLLFLLAGVVIYVEFYEPDTRLSGVLMFIEYLFLGLGVVSIAASFRAMPIIITDQGLALPPYLFWKKENISGRKLSTSHPGT